MILRIILFTVLLYVVYPSCNKWYDHVAMPVRFIENLLVPDIVELPPSGKLLVTTFDGKGIAFYPGQEMSRLDFFHPPDNFSWEAEPNTHYTLFFSTPDHPLDKEFNQFKQLHHWVVSNIPGCDVSRGDVIIKYTKPLRYNGIGYCRYVFLVYKQDRPIKAPDFDDQITGLQVNFTCTEFAKRFRLGKLWAGNYFTIYY